MDFELVSLSGIKMHKEIYEVIAPTTGGDIAVFPGHEPLIAVIVPGVMHVRYDKSDSNEKMEILATSGGIIEISQKAVKVLVDEVAYSHEIVESETKKALEHAIELRNHASDQIELEKAHQLVDRHSVRLKVAELHRTRR